MPWINNSFSFVRTILDQYYSMDTFLKKPVIVKKIDNPVETPKDWIILSFDIGIKHLAYCRIALNKADPNKKFTVLNWDIINMADQDDFSCQGIQKRNKKVCGKHAMYRYNNQTYCKIHVPDEQNAEIIKKSMVDKLSNQELNLRMVKELDKLPFLFDCDEVLLEHQPDKNPRMKNISFMLYSYFVIRGLVDKPDSRLKNIQIRQINSDKKLSLYDGPQVACNLKDKYSQNKFYSMTYCEYLIRNDSKWLPFYKGFKKKDDLADCFLQGAWFLTKHRASK